jgi:hypothetical protein
VKSRFVGLLRAFVRIVQLWLSRDQRRKITVSVYQVPDGKTITIEGERISIDTLTSALGAAIKSETTATAEPDAKSTSDSSNFVNQFCSRACSNHPGRPWSATGQRTGKSHVTHHAGRIARNF